MGFTALVRLGGLRFAALAASSIVGVCAALLIPATAAATIDAVLAEGPPGLSGRTGNAGPEGLSGLAGAAELTGQTGLAVLSVLIAVRALAGVCDDVARISVTTRVAASLRLLLVRHVLAVSLRGRRRHSTGDQVDRLTSDTRSASAGVPAAVDAGVRLCASVAGLVALSLIDWRLAVTFAVGALAAVVPLRRAMPRGAGGDDPGVAYAKHQGAIAARLGDALAAVVPLRRAMPAGAGGEDPGVAYAKHQGAIAARLGDALAAVVPLRRAIPAGAGVEDPGVAYAKHQGAIAARLGDALAGGRTIRACGTGPVEVARILAPLPGLAEAGMRFWAELRPASWRMDAAATVVQVLVLAVCGWGLVAGRISAGEFLAALLYLGFALGLVDRGDYPARLAAARSAARRVGEVPAESGRPETVHIGHSSGLPPGPGALSLRGIRERDGDRLVLDGVDLDVPAGTSVALVGRPGAGRRTLALLAGGLRHPEQGRVLIDGVAVDAVAPASLRRDIAYAFGRPALLGRTVREVLTGGDAAVDARVEPAAETTGALAFISRLPRGFDTPLADSPFSAGERQLIAITRAVARGGRLLVLDDAVPGVDDVTSARITDAITVRLAGRTRMIVAHREATAERADLVAWLKEGRVRAVAPHHALMLTEPEYPLVFRAWERP